MVSWLMPFSIVQAKEYECIRCKYKWINRKNGEEKPAPKYCPSCKSSLWDTQRGGWRMRVERHQCWVKEHPDEEQERILAELAKET